MLMPADCPQCSALNVCEWDRGKQPHAMCMISESLLMKKTDNGSWERRWVNLHTIVSTQPDGNQNLVSAKSDVTLMFVRIVEARDDKTDNLRASRVPMPFANAGFAEHTSSIGFKCRSRGGRIQAGNRTGISGVASPLTIQVGRQARRCYISTLQLVMLSKRKKGKKS